MKLQATCVIEYGHLSPTHSQIHMTYGLLSYNSNPIQQNNNYQNKI